jgi:O-antigen/teichoic acid export membrane protein
LGVIQRQGIKNTIITYTGILVGFLNILFIQPRFLTAQEIGLTRVLFNFSSLISVFLPLGIGVITVKYFPIFRDEKNKHNGFFGFMLLFMLVGFAFISAMLFIFKGYIFSVYQKESPLFTEFYNYIFPLSLILGFNAVLTLYANSVFKTTVPALLNEVLVRILSIVLFTVYFIKLITLTQFIALFVGVYGTQFLFLLLYIIRVGHPGLTINWPLIRKSGFGEMIRYGLVLSFVSIATLGIKYLDSLIIGTYFVLDKVGIYAIVAFIPTVLEAPLNALDRITNTKIAHSLAERDYNEVKKVYYQSVKYLLVIGGLLFIGIVTNITFLLKFLPAQYSEGVGVVYIISIGVLFNLAGGANTSIIFNSENYWKGAILLVALVIITLILNIVLIPIYGINGAAIATAISTFLYAAIKFVIINRQYKLQPYDRNTLIITGLIGMCLVINYFLPVFASSVINIALRTIVFTGIYTAIVWYFQIVPEMVGIIKSIPGQMRPKL